MALPKEGLSSAYPTNLRYLSNTLAWERRLMICKFSTKKSSSIRFSKGNNSESATSLVIGNPKMATMMKILYLFTLIFLISCGQADKHSDKNKDVLVNTSIENKDKTVKFLWRDDKYDETLKQT